MVGVLGWVLERGHGEAIWGRERTSEGWGVDWGKAGEGWGGWGARKRAEGWGGSGQGEKGRKRGVGGKHEIAAHVLGVIRLLVVG